MNSGLVLTNIALYCLQVGLLIGVAAFLPRAVRLRLPGARLAFWHVLLAACLLVPLVGPRQEQFLPALAFPTGAPAPAMRTPSPVPAAPPAGGVSRAEIVLALLAAGALGRLIWLGAGFARLRRYRRRSRPLTPAPSWSVEADIRLSEDVASPVAFGLRKPVVLLPAGFPLLDAATREAVLAHECLHVRRHDWAFTMAEELVRTVFWFHPAIWWLLGEIQLAREQAVDRAAVEMTRACDEYVDALLALAGSTPRLDLAPAPLFLRRRHLKQRITSLLKEPYMSKEKTIPALAAGLCFLAAACWLVTGVFPLTAAPQTVTDAPGVTVDTGGAALLHRTAIPYPETARANGVQGMVTVEAMLDSRGNVVNFGAISGPEQLRVPVLKSLLNWHFTRDSAGKTRQVSVLFQAPPGAAEREPAAAPPSIPGAESRTITAITVTGLPDSVRNDLLASLPVRAGSTLGREDLAAVRAAIQRFDEHLTLTSVPNPEGVEIRIAAPGARQSATPAVSSKRLGGVLGGILSSPGNAAPSSVPPARIPVGGNVQAAKIVQMVTPVYPPLAKQARIQGKVILSVVVGQDGAVTSVTLENGHALLAGAAIEAVRQWTYKPTLLNGEPVEVVTTVEVNFTLPAEAQL